MLKIVTVVKVADSYYNTSNDTGTIKCSLSNKDIDYIRQFLEEAYSKTSKKFQPDILTDEKATLNLHTKFNLPIYVEGESERKDTITPEQFGTIKPNTSFKICIGYNENKKSGVYPVAIQVKSLDDLQYKEAFNPFI